jgi:cytochrome c-type biogenesis protein CcmH
VTNALRPTLLLLALAACGGAPAPAPPAVDAGAPLPPGHPPVEGAAAPLPSGHPPVGDAPAAAARVSGTITLGPGLSVSPSDVLYVMAKSGAATLAVRRVETPSFPYDFEISGGDSMAGDASFAGPVDVVARVSRTGDAIPAPGDIEGTARGVAVPGSGVRLTIDSVRR